MASPEPRPADRQETRSPGAKESRVKKLAALLVVLVSAVTVALQAPTEDTCLLVSAENLARGGGNFFLYCQISTQNYTFQAGDRLEYDILLPAGNPSPKGGVDADLREDDSLKGRLKDVPWLRDAGIEDQKGIRLHGDGALEPAKDRWYHRAFDLTPVAGTTAVRWNVQFEGDEKGIYIQLLDNIRVTNGGKTVLTIYENGPTPAMELRQRSGYSTRVLIASSPKGAELSDFLKQTIEKARKLNQLNSEREKFAAEIDVARTLATKSRDHDYIEGVNEAAAAEDLAAYEAGDADKYLASVEKGRELLRKVEPHMHGVTGHLVGHAHIDLQWLWPWSECVDHIIPDTFGQAIKFMDEFPEFTFTQSSGTLYETTKKYHPELYSKMKKRIAEGRWEVVGGRWCEGDTNMISGESHARHMLYGQRFFKSEFDRWCDVGWEPDTFGHTWTMPQILKKSGIDYYYFCRGGKQIPLFWWESPDGTRVLAFDEPATGGWYNGEIGTKEVKELAEFLKTTGAFDHLMVYGVGNHGGGPTREQIKNALAMRDLPGYPKIRFSTAHDFFVEVSKVAEKLDLPVVKTELNPVFEGCYTTHSAVKKLNRDSEALLPQAETFAAFAGGPYPRELFADLWKDVCWNHHHDTLPGSFIHLASFNTDSMYGVVLRKGAEILKKAQGAIASRIPLAEGGHTVVAFNPLAWSRSEVVEAFVPGTFGSLRVLDGDKATPGQVISTQNGMTRFCFLAAGVPGAGFKTFRVEAGPAVSAPVAPATIVPRFEILHEAPHGMSAWTVGAFDRSEDLRPGQAQWIESGPVRWRKRTVYRYGSSTITQDALTYQGSDRVDYETKVDWMEIGNARAGGPMLKVAFDTKLQAKSATYEIPFGDITRPNDGHENVALKWCDVSEAGSGITILNDCKHAYDAKGGTVRLTLLRASFDPDPVPDLGTHMMRYAAVPHDGPLDRGATSRLSFEFNEPMNTITLDGSASLSWSGCSVGPTNIVVTAIKRWEDGNDFIVRAYETNGVQTEATFDFAFEALAAKEVDLIERDMKEQGRLRVAGRKLVAGFKPYEIRTFRIRAR